MIARRWILCFVLLPLLSAAASTPALSSSEKAAAPPTVPELKVPPLPPGVPSAVPLGRPLTIEQAVEIALSRQPQIALARSGLQAAMGAAKQTESAAFPSVNLVGQHTRTSAAGIGAVGGQFTTSGYTMNVSGRQLIYDFGRTPAAVGQALGQQASAVYSLEQTQQDTINSVKQAYYTLLQDQELAGVQKQNVADQQAHLDLVRGQFGAGVSPRADVIQAEAAVSAAVVNFVTAQNTAAVSRVTLNTAIGIDPRTPVIVEQAVEAVPPVPVEDLVTYALAHRPEIEQLRQSVQAARQGLTAALTSNFPAFYLNGSYGLQGREFPPTATSWAYGVSVSWPVFDVGQTRGLIQQAQATLDSAQASLAQGEQSVTAEVVQDYLNVQTAEQQVSASAIDVANAQESLGVALGSYRAGVVPYINVTDAQTALVTAETSQVNARYALSMARAALARALGMAGY